MIVICALLALRCPQYQTVTILASSTQEAYPVMCTLNVSVVESNDHCLVNTIVKRAVWVDNQSMELMIIPNPKVLARIVSYLS